MLRASIPGVRAYQGAYFKGRETLWGQNTVLFLWKGYRIVSLLELGIPCTVFKIGRNRYFSAVKKNGKWFEDAFPFLGRKGLAINKKKTSYCIFTSLYGNKNRFLALPSHPETPNQDRFFSLWPLWTFAFSGSTVRTKNWQLEQPGNCNWNKTLGSLQQIFRFLRNFSL
jgi:hypothetical protein